MYCHDRVGECPADCPRLEIEHLEAENHRLKGMLGDLLHWFEHHAPAYLIDVQDIVWDLKQEVRDE